MDAELERYDLEQDSPYMVLLLYWIPLVGIIYYFVRIRGIRASVPLVTRAFLFVLLMIALFITTNQFSRNVLSNL